MAGAQGLKLGNDRDSAVLDADDPMAELKKMYLEGAQSDVSNLETAIDTAMSDSSTWDMQCKTMREITHNVKGQGTSFGYPLMTDVGDSLSKLLKSIDDPQPPTLKLVAAHIQSLRTVLDKNIEGSGGDLGTALIARLRGLVEKMGG